MAVLTKEFQTLTGFQEVVQGCLVSAPQHPFVELNDGLRMAAEKILQTGKTGNKIMLIGNGGSAAIASHQATDLWKNGGIRALAFNDASLLTCAANDYGYSEVFAKPVERFGDAGDVLIAISSSGQSASIVNAVKVAREKDCFVIGFSGFDQSNSLRSLGDLNFYLSSHSYGIVEVGHLLLLHAIVDDVIRRGS